MLQINGTAINLTRGDSAYIVLPVLTACGKPYILQEGDEVALQVRNATISNSETLHDVIIEGDISLNSEGVPVWHISAEDSTINAQTYAWDVEIRMANGDVCTYNNGTLTIMPEVTLIEAE